MRTTKTWFLLIQALEGKKKEKKPITLNKYYFAFMNIYATYLQSEV